MQYSIITALVKNGNLTIVGDDFQAIFGWRGAKPDFFINAQDQIENSKLFKLEQNYRSTKNIVTMSNDIIKRNTNQVPKTCYSLIESEIKPNIIKFDDDVIEAKKIAEACQMAVNELGYSFNDIAILYRAKFNSRGVEQALTDLFIPYSIIGSVAFFERREIKDIMSYLKFAFNTMDNEAFTRSISVPKRGIGKSAIQKIQKQKGDSLLIKLYYSLSSLSNKASKEALKYYNLINKIINKKPSDAITEIVNSIDYKKELKSISTDEDDYIDRKENINELLNFSSKFEKLSDLIDESSLMTSDDKDTQTGKVKLMTVHSAKGLEFEIVFVIGLEDGLFPHWKSLKSDKELGTNEHLEEERRLFYVATTRAKTILNISTVKSRSCSFANNVSRFIGEIEDHCITYDLTKNKLGTNKCT
jgi:DNA helicase-2/ATP-dependent DNA helicase PcrA